jgi:hypothetical protein
MASALKYAFYVAFNAFSVFVGLMFVFYANTFLNDSLLPDDWTYRGKMLGRVVVALTEAAILFCIAYVSNRLIASVLFLRGKTIAAWATAFSFVVVAVVVVVSAWGVYRQGL